MTIDVKYAMFVSDGVPPPLPMPLPLPLPPLFVWM
jgi:hypothetical protein